MVPHLMVLTDRSQCRIPLLEVVAQSVDAGASGILVREKDLPAKERHILLQNVANITQQSDCLIIAASNTTVDVDGLHLSQLDPMPAARPHMIGRSCHNGLEVAAARRELCDYVTLSPIFPTRSKPGYGPAQGTELLAETVDAANIPVLALGGVEPDTAHQCAKAGTHGIAVMGCVMRSEQPGAIVRSLVKHLRLV